MHFVIQTYFSWQQKLKSLSASWEMSHGLNPHRILGIDVLRLKKNSGYQELQSKHVPSVNEPLKTQIGAVHTSLFSSHHPVFPALVPVPAPFPQSGRHRSVPLALSAVFFGKTEGSDSEDGEDAGPGGSKQTSGSSAMALAVIKWADAVWCKPLSALGSPDRKSSHFDSCSRFVVIRYCPPANDVSLSKTGWTPTALFCKLLWHFLKIWNRWSCNTLTRLKAMCLIITYLAF